MFESLFQSYEDGVDPGAGGPRLSALRAALRAGDLDGFVVPRADAHQNEYVPPCDERLAWLTGFTGSAGLAIVLADRAAIFIDGRYTVQVRAQVDGRAFEPVDIGITAPSAWLAANAPAGSRIGYDPWLHTRDSAARLRAACATAGAELVAVTPNPIDALWQDRPAPPLSPIVLHDATFAGEAAADKIARVQAEIARGRADSLVVSDPHSLAWLLNIRGGDVAHTPLPIGWGVVPATGRAILIADSAKISNAVRAELESFCEVRGIADFRPVLAEIARGGRLVRLDAATAADALAIEIEALGARVEAGVDPIALMKAVKNAAEIAGTRAAHLRDGAAVTRFLAWFEREAPGGRLDEITAAQALETFRRETGLLRDVSFPTISAAGENAALPHYRVTRSTNRAIDSGLFLIDSGAQYEDGTTDITRTIAVGEATPAMKDRYTRVLKGHIAIATARFPRGASGAQLDPFARRALWDAGADFDHGTGHGVGSYLSVHEGPQRISKLGHTVLQPGMILSNEPGYYREGAFGIRIENLVLVQQSAQEGDERAMLAFETLTLAPIDLAPVDPSLLTTEECDWIDAYHAHVRAELSPLLDDATREWLAGATRPISRSAP